MKKKSLIITVSAIALVCIATLTLLITMIARNGKRKYLNPQVTACSRDLLKKHDTNKDYNVFWELLLSSPTPKFEGFYGGRLPDGSVIAKFGKFDYNQTGIVEIQRGILDFVKEYHSHFREFPYMFNISGRDAYAPMLVAASHREKYLKAVEKRFKLEINVDQVD